MKTPTKHATSNPNPGYIKFPDGKLVKVRDEQGKFTKEFLNASAKEVKNHGAVLPPTKLRQL